jgi:hypothetical protein
LERRISLLHLLIIALCFALTLVLGNHSFKDDIAASDRFLSPPPEHMELFTFGFADSMADSLWLRWIQDSDSCVTYKSALPANPIPAQEGEFSNPRHKFCDNSWAFKMLDSITRLAPQFKMPYQAGAITLSVLVEDYEGAKVIFDRGVEAFPQDWQLLYRAAYHYLFDRHDLTHSAELMVRAEKAGAPSWLSLLAARLYSKAGRAEMGIHTLEEFRKSLTSQKDIDNVDKRITELKKQMYQ